MLPRPDAAATQPALRDFERVASEMDRGHIDPAMLVTSVVALDDLPSIFDRLRGTNAETKVQVRLAGSGE